MRIPRSRYGYCWVWLSAVLAVAAIDSISDALGRPSIFTTERVLILLASMFAIGLPWLFFTAADGVGWKLISPVVFGCAVYGFGLAFQSDAIRELAYLPVRALESLLGRAETAMSWVCTWALKRLKEGLEAFMSSPLVQRAVGQLVEARLPVGVAVMSLVVVKSAAGHLEECEIGGFASQIHCIVGGFYGLVGVCGVLLSVELVLETEWAAVSVKPFTTGVAATLAVLGFTVTHAVPRVTNTVVGTTWDYAVLFCTKIKMLARELQLVRYGTRAIPTTT